MAYLVILPTYNEKDNIEELIKALLIKPECEVMVVDDNSPDGTAQIVKTMQAKQGDRLHLFVRGQKDGRGGAVRAGLEWGLAQNKFAAFVEMDTDFSHPPEDIAKGLALLKQYQVALGSRYPDGKIIGWPLQRKIMSFCANRLARALINPSIADYTNGFRFYTAEAARYVCSIPMQNKGYIYLSETLAHLLNGGFSIGSFPIIFVNRQRGVSNTNFKEVFDSLKAIFKIARQYHRNKKNAD